MRMSRWSRFIPPALSSISAVAAGLVANTSTGGFALAGVGAALFVSWYSLRVSARLSMPDDEPELRYALAQAVKSEAFARINVRNADRELPSQFQIGDSVAISDIAQLRYLHNSFLVLGPAGAGKTTALLSLVASLWETLEPDVLPLYLPAASLTGPDALEEKLARVLVREYGLTRQLALKWIAHGEIIPVIDSLDELPKDLSQRLYSQITAWARSDRRIVAASRPEPWILADAAPELAVLWIRPPGSDVIRRTLLSMAKRVEIERNSPGEFNWLRTALQSRADLTINDYQAFKILVLEGDSDLADKVLQGIAYPERPLASLTSAERTVLDAMEPGVSYHPSQISSRTLLVPSEVRAVLASLDQKGLVASNSREVDQYVRAVGGRLLDEAG